MQDLEIGLFIITEEKDILLNLAKEKILYRSNNLTIYIVKAEEYFGHPAFLKAETFHGENRKLDSQSFMEGEWPV